MPRIGKRRRRRQEGHRVLDPDVGALGLLRRQAPQRPLVVDGAVSVDDHDEPVAVGFQQPQDLPDGHRKRAFFKVEALDGELREIHPDDALGALEPQDGEPLRLLIVEPDGFRPDEIGRQDDPADPPGDLHRDFVGVQSVGAERQVRSVPLQRPDGHEGDGKPVPLLHDVRRTHQFVLDPTDHACLPIRSAPSALPLTRVIPGGPALARDGTGDPDRRRGL